MTITSGTIWEFRAASGASTAGGGFGSDVASAGSDFSNQDSAEESYTTLATADGTTTTITCSGGDTFDANIIGNVIQIASGTNFNAGFYQVLTRTSSTEITVDRSPASAAGSSGVGAMGGALDILTDNFFDASESGLRPGNTIYIKNDGTMTLTISISASRDGTLFLPINIEGYNTSRGDNPTGSNRPVIAAAENQFSLDDFYKIQNLIVTCTSTGGISLDQNGTINNCKCTNSSGSSNRDAFNLITHSKIIRCEAVSTNGEGIVPALNDIRIISCYIHDSTIGINIGGSDSTVIYGCIIDTNTTGISASTGSNDNTIINNTFYNNTTHIDVGATSDDWVIINNIFDAGTDGVKWGDADRSLFMDFNIWDNSTDVTNVIKGDNAITGDPGLTDPSNGDFTLGGGSNAIDTGLDANDTTGATV